MEAELRALRVQIDQLRRTIEETRKDRDTQIAVLEDQLRQAQEECAKLRAALRKTTTQFEDYRNDHEVICGALKTDIRAIVLETSPTSSNGATNDELEPEQAPVSSSSIATNQPSSSVPRSAAPLLSPQKRKSVDSTGASPSLTATVRTTQAVPNVCASSNLPEARSSGALRTAL